MFKLPKKLTIVSVIFAIITGIALSMLIVVIPKKSFSASPVLATYTTITPDNSEKNTQAIAATVFTTSLTLTSDSFSQTIAADSLNNLVNSNSSQISAYAKQLISQNNSYKKDFGDNGQEYYYTLNKKNWKLDEVNMVLNDIVNAAKSGKGIQINIKLSEVEINGTDGTLAPRYIEVDTTKQKLYGWQDGKVVKEYYVSGGMEGYEAWGIHTVMNKNPNAWSNTADKWMPYWMAFYYDPNQKAYYGFHQLTNWTDDTGYHEEPESRLYQRVSKGCVRLKKGEAKDFYDWAQVGDLVLIHK
jgi:lipoprotein-anchoring transpeptidase ErfK/SrfK